MSESIEHLRFEVLMRDVVVDDARRIERMARRPEADRSYVILFSARSGSTWLTSTVVGTKRLGNPHEYINPTQVVNNCRRTDAATQEQLLAMLKRVGATPNGVFGMECRAVDIALFGEAPFMDCFADTAVWFHLWRANIVAQGISLYRAVRTQHFHSNAPVGADAPPPDYDAAGMLEWTRHVAATENENVALLARYGIAAQHLVYEEITADRLGTLRRLASALKVPCAPTDFVTPAGNELTRLGDAWNAAAETRLRAECRVEIAAIEAARLVLHGVAAGAPRLAPGDPASAKAFAAGQQTAWAGRSIWTNPHPAEDAVPFAAWRNGWRCGWDDQLYRTDNNA